jgi:hypothetical protein
MRWRNPQFELPEPTLESIAAHVIAIASRATTLDLDGATAAFGEYLKDLVGKTQKIAALNAPQGSAPEDTSGGGLPARP